MSKVSFICKKDYPAEYAELTQAFLHLSHLTYLDVEPSCATLKDGVKAALEGFLQGSAETVLPHLENKAWTMDWVNDKNEKVTIKTIPHPDAYADATAIRITITEDEA